MADDRPALGAPKQRRSHATLERILEATESLLETKEFDRISMREIVRAAETSTGSYYNLFRDKRALLAGLYERYDAGLDRRIEAWREGVDAPVDLETATAWVARYLIESFRSRRHLLRALALFVRTYPEEQTPEFKRRRVAQHRFLLDALLEWRDEITHPEPETAVETAVFVAASVARERVLFTEGAHASSFETTDERLRRDLAVMLVGFLRPDAGLDPSLL